MYSSLSPFGVPMCEMAFPGSDSWWSRHLNLEPARGMQWTSVPFGGWCCRSAPWFQTLPLHAPLPARNAFSSCPVTQTPLLRALLKFSYSHSIFIVPTSYLTQYEKFMHTVSFPRSSVYLLRQELLSENSLLPPLLLHPAHTTAPNT